MMNVADVLQRSPVIPVLEIENPVDAEPLAEALLSGGLTIAEVTLRTSSAFDVIYRMSRAFPELLVGAGTITSCTQISGAITMGARFLVSPASTETLLSNFREAKVPVLPGVGTVSEVLAVKQAGFCVQKFFPAELNGGISFIRAVRALMPDVKFCPTGGISPDKVEAYLSEPNVACVGGSWIATRQAVADRDWAGIRERSAVAASVRKRQG